jgi:nicotinamidase-related amidase
VALDVYVANRTGLLLVDPYNDLLSDGGKLWPRVKAVADSIGTLANLLALTDAAREAGVVVVYVPHRQWRESNYDGWRHPGPWQSLLDREAVFAEGSWGSEWHPDLAPQAGDVVVQPHWGQDGFANTDLDFQLRQFGLQRIIVAGLLANICVEATARRGAELGYHVTLVRDATAAFGEDSLRAAMDINGPTYAHAVLTTEAIIARLSGSSPSEATSSSNRLASRKSAVASPSVKRR